MSGSHQFVRVWDRATGSRRRRLAVAVLSAAVAGASAGAAASGAALDRPAAEPTDRVELVIPVAASSPDESTVVPAGETSVPPDGHTDAANAPPPAAIPFPSAIQLFVPGAALAAYAIRRIRRRRRWGATG